MGEESKVMKREQMEMEKDLRRALRTVRLFFRLERGYWTGSPHEEEVMNRFASDEARQITALARVIGFYMEGGKIMPNASEEQFYGWRKRRTRVLRRGPR